MNLERHGVSFDEASTAFRDPLSQTIEDPLHSELEEHSLGDPFKGGFWLSSIRTEAGEYVLSVPGWRQKKRG